WHSTSLRRIRSLIPPAVRRTWRRRRRWNCWLLSTVGRNDARPARPAAKESGLVVDLRHILVVPHLELDAACLSTLAPDAAASCADAEAPAVAGFPHHHADSPARVLR